MALPLLEDKGKKWQLDLLEISFLYYTMNLQEQICFEQNVMLTELFLLT